MTAVIGAKDRATNKVNARVIESTDKDTLHGFVTENAEPGAVVYTDDAPAYEGIPNPHESVKHSVSEYVNGMAHTNGIESFWSMLKSAHKGTFHRSARSICTLRLRIRGQTQRPRLRNACQTRDTVARLIGRNLLYRDLIASNGLSNASVVTVRHGGTARAPASRASRQPNPTFGSSFGMYFMLQPSIRPLCARPCCGCSPSKAVAG